MQNTFPFGGSYTSGTDTSGTAVRERGGYVVPAGQRPIGTYTGVPVTGVLGRFTDVDQRRVGTATATTRTVTGSLRTATGSFRAA